MKSLPFYDRTFQVNIFCLLVFVAVYVCVCLVNIKCMLKHLWNEAKVNHVSAWGHHSQKPTWNITYIRHSQDNWEHNLLCIFPVSVYFMLKCLWLGWTFRTKYKITCDAKSPTHIDMSFKMKKRTISQQKTDKKCIPNNSSNKYIHYTIFQTEEHALLYLPIHILYVIVAKASYYVIWIKRRYL